MLNPSDVTLAQSIADTLAEKVTHAKNPALRLALQEAADQWTEVAELGRRALDSSDQLNAR